MPDAKLKALTYRIEGIPYGTTEEQLKTDYFYSEDHDDIWVKSLYPSVDCVEGEEEGDLTATIFYRPREPRPDGPRLQKNSITIDRDFSGFTPLYVPPPKGGPIAADIIAVTGLAGHAFGSWAHSDDKMWLRDYMKDFAKNARILTYGYSSHLHNSISTNMLQDHTTKFVHSLLDMREEGQTYHIHRTQSWGFNHQESFDRRGIDWHVSHEFPTLVKAPSDTSSNASRLPVRAIIFLAAPHKGIDVTALQTLVKGQPSETMITDLKQGSSLLVDLNSRFAQMAQDIDILSCYELKMTKTATLEKDGTWKRNGPPVMMVSADSAMLYTQKEIRVAADSDHSEIAKIKKGQAGIISHVRSAIRRALRPTADIVADVNPETSRRMQYHAEPHVSPPPVYRYESPGPQPSTLMPKQTSQVDFSPSTSVDLPVRRLPPDTPHTQNNEASTDNRAVSSPISTAGSAQEAIVPPNIPDLPSEKYSTLPQTVREIGPTPSSLDAGLRAESPSHPPDPERGSTHYGTHEDSLSLPTEPLYKRDVVYRKDKTKIKQPKSVDKPVVESHDEIQSTSITDKDDPVACCKICDRLIPNDEFHWLCQSCDDEFEPESESDDVGRSCQRCIRVSSLCLEHGEQLEKVYIKARNGFHHTVRYVSDEISDFDSVIVKAIKQNDLDELKYRVADRRLLAAYDRLGVQPLHIALQLGRIDCAQILLEAGAPTEARERSESNDTPLRVAVDYDNVQAVQMLLELNVIVDHPGGPDNLPALCQAAINGQSDIVGLLLAYGAQTDPITMDDDLTALQHACFIGDVKSATMLLQAGAKVDVVDPEMGYSLLSGAARLGFASIVSLLLSWGVDVNVRDEDESTALLAAVCSGKTSVTRILLEHGADPNLIDSDGLTPLHMAAREGYVANMALLLRYGAKTGVTNKQGMTPLMSAATEGKVKTCQVLLDTNVDPDVRRAGDLQTAMMQACVKGHTDIVGLLLDYGAKTETIDKEGYTCLHRAADLGKFKICELLLRRHAAVGKKVGEQTALHLACHKGNKQCAKHLLVYGADPNAFDKDCLFPLWYAGWNGNNDLATILLAHGADIDRVEPPWSPTTRYNAVAAAAHGGHVETVRFLLDRGASGTPPPGNAGKWKNQAFAESVTEAKKHEILRLLRLAKHS